MKIDFDSGWWATLDDETDSAGRPWCVLRPAADGVDPQGLAEGLRPHLQQRGANRLLVEMNDVSFLSSSLIGELVGLHKRSAMAGGELRLSAFQPPCFEAIKTCRLDQVLNHFLNRAEALGSG